MKSFYGGSSAAVAAASAPVHLDPFLHSYIDTHARVAVYDAAASAPYVEDVGPAAVDQFIEMLTVRVFELARQRGGAIPYTVIREVAENLIHAGFAEPVVSVLDSGNTIRFTDQGPGIPDKQRAVRPGYTTAQSYMKPVIRGVGSGLPIVNDFLSVAGGTLLIEDNLAGGSVVTITLCPTDAGPVSADSSAAPGPQVHAPSDQAASAIGAGEPDLFTEQPAVSEGARLTTRQKHVMALVLESGAAGPSVVSRELGVGLSTAYRDLASLEELGLIVSEGGKRTLTEKGLLLLGDLSSHNNLSSLRRDLP